MVALPWVWRRRGWVGAAAAVVIAASVAALLRMPFLHHPAWPDEGGYLLVAERWHEHGSTLYGDLWVDRPPLLILFFRVSASLGGLEAARLLACAAVVVAVLAAGAAGWLIGDRRGAVWAAVTAAALLSSPALGTAEVDGELLAVPLVMVGCLCALLAVRATTSAEQLAWAGLAGATGASALLVKQNMLDALVFGFVLVLMATIRGSLPARAGPLVVGTAILGALVPLVATAVWAHNEAPGINSLWYSLYGFRSDALHVILTHSLKAPSGRLVTLLRLGVVSGVFLLALAFLWSARRLLRRLEPVTVALTCMLLAGLIGIALGANFWPHYLIALVPVLSLASGSVGGSASARGVWPKLAACLVVVSSLNATASASVAGVASSDGSDKVARWIRAAARPTDTLFVAYAHAALIEETGLRPDYPYVWTLPMRTLDPDLTVLYDDLTGPAAPTWVVKWDSLNTWDIDPAGRISAALRHHYRLAAIVDGHRIYLHDGVRRRLPAAAGPLASARPRPILGEQQGEVVP